VQRLADATMLALVELQRSLTQGAAQASMKKAPGVRRRAATKRRPGLARPGKAAPAMRTLN